MRRLEEHDPGNKYAVPYMWGTTGIGFNVAKVKERLGDDMPTDTWSLILDPKVVAKLADCGVTVLDAPSEVFDIARNFLGLPPTSQTTCGATGCISRRSRSRSRRSPTCCRMRAVSSAGAKGRSWC